MTNVRNFKEFKKALEEKVEKSLNKNVKQVIISETNERIKHDVYGVYDPISYNRRESLYDLDNYKSSVKTVSNGVQLSVEHHATVDGGKNLTKLIILGQQGAKAYGSDIAQYNDEWIKKTKFRYSKYGKSFDKIPFYEPRNFIASTKQVLSFDRNRIKLIEEFKKGMR